MSFPKWVYNAAKNETVLCNSPDHRRSLGEGWTQCPPPVEAKPQSEVAEHIALSEKIAPQLEIAPEVAEPIVAEPVKAAPKPEAAKPKKKKLWSRA